MVESAETRNLYCSFKDNICNNLKAYTLNAKVTTFLCFSVYHRVMMRAGGLENTENAQEGSREQLSASSVNALQTSRVVSRRCAARSMNELFF